MTNDRQNALAQIAALAQSHGLSAEDIAAHLHQSGQSAPEAQRNLLVTMLSYLGGLLVFCGIGYAISLQWDTLGSAQRILVTFGTGFSALLLGLACLRDQRFVRATTPLFLIAGLLQPTGLFVMLKEYASGNDGALACVIVFTPLAAQMLALFAKLRRTSLLFLGITYTTIALWAAMYKIGMDQSVIAFGIGVSGLLLAGLINRSADRALAPLSYFVFAGFVAGGAFELLEGSFLDILLIPVGAFLILGSIRARSRTFLFTAMLSMLCYLCYYTATYFANTMGWPLALIVIGLAMIGLSAWAVKLGRNMTRASDAP